MNAQRILELVEERREFKDKIRQIDQDLLRALREFDGTLQEALDSGLVKPAFPLPNGYHRMRRERLQHM
jgi:hypothetical protein